MGIAPDEQRMQQNRTDEKRVNKAEVLGRRYTYHYQVCISAEAAMWLAGVRLQVPGRM